MLELDAHADKHQAAEEQEHAEARRETGCERGERVEQNTPGEHAASAETIGEITAEQTEDAARDGRHIEQNAEPSSELRRARLNAAEFEQGRPQDQRQH